MTSIVDVLVSIVECHLVGTVQIDCIVRIDKDASRFSVKSAVVGERGCIAVPSSIQHSCGRLYGTPADKKLSVDDYFQ